MSSVLHKRLGDVLIERGIATPQIILDAVARQAKSGRQLGELLVEMKVATEDEIAEALAEQQDVPTWDLKRKPAEPDALKLLSAVLCLRHSILPVKVDGQILTLAMMRAGNLATIDEVRKVTGLWVQAVHVADKQLLAAIEEAYGASRPGRVESYVDQAMDEYGFHTVEDQNPIVREEETRPVIGLVNEIIADAVRMRASDIHLEPHAGGMDLRYRVDGRLIKTREIPLALVPMVTARIKIMADLDVADHRLPQDGRIPFKLDRRSIDLRVSILPCHYGSRSVMRVLDRNAVLRQLDELGFSAENARLFRHLIEKPYGIVLVTGPTGSGKTTTLYAALNEIRDEATNIMTCEDPIEYELKGISQSQVHEKIGLTFAAQLRSILRQDPDVVLVGEIRDAETAEIAIRAALTGHLVLSTLHCNDAASALPRLIDMGVPAYMVSTSLIGVVAQRLLRILCPHCKQKGAPTERDLEIMRALGVHCREVWQPVGCDECHKTGYRGRMGVHEILPISEDMGRLIAHGESVEILRDKGGAHGYRPMQFDAVDRVQAGLTTFEEARRLVFFQDGATGEAEDIQLSKAS